jgi:hypothetical protein
MAAYDSPGHRDPLPGIPGFQSHDSGMTAPGSDGITNSAPGVGGSSVIASPVVSVPFASSQLAESMPVVPVTAGDTSAMTDDMPAHASGIDGTSDAAPYMDTGAGSGHVVTSPHPNAGG